MTRYEKGGPPPAPRSIQVQGITIRPGDKVILELDGERVLRTYEGQDDGGYIWLKRDTWSTAAWCDEGPFHITQLRHPDLLTGIVKEIDGAE